MGKVLHGRWLPAGAAAVLAAMAGGAWLFTSPPKASTVPPAKPLVELSPLDAPPHGTEAVEMFAAIDRGDLAARLRPDKDQQARLELENRTDRPLTVQAPATFGGRYILAGVGVGLPAGAGTHQPLINTPLPVVGMRTNGGVMFYIPPEKVGCLRTRTVCLDESKPEPTPGMIYEVCRPEELTEQPAVQRLCSMLGDAETDPLAVQAAVWHLKCHLSWPQLAARLRSLGGPHGTQRFFTAKQIEEAKRLVGCVERTGEKTAAHAPGRNPKNALRSPGPVRVTHECAGISVPARPVPGAEAVVGRRSLRDLVPPYEVAVR
jgi:hypothetical protein